MAGEVDPAFGWVDGVMLAAWFDTRRDRQTGDSEACQLTLTAPEATDRIAHQEDLGEVFTAQGRAAKLLAGAELTLDGNAMVRVQSQVRDAFLGGVRAVSPSAGAFVFVLECHLYVIIFPGEVEGRRVSPLRGGDYSVGVACELGGLPRVRQASRAVHADREGPFEACGADASRLWVRRCRWRGRVAVLCA
jgi:hypothetical protein